MRTPDRTGRFIGLGFLVTAIATFCLLAPPPRAFAYGREGHETVGAIADELIKGTPAEKQVKALLPGDSLSHAATWADRAKGKYSTLDKEMKDFVNANREHRRYHYTDVPFEEATYRDNTAGTSSNDVVHIMTQCIEVLQGRQDPRANPHRFSRRIALLLLAHYVGDIHQPLHVGAAYLDDRDSFVNPNSAGHAPDFGIGHGIEADQGGNALRYGSSVLHSFWDSGAVLRAMRKAAAQTPQQYASYILKHPPANWQTAGPPAGWPRAWTGEILPVAARAHADLQVGPRRNVADRSGAHPQWTVTPPDGYEDWAAGTVHDEIGKAGYRLARLLQEIWP